MIHQPRQKLLYSLIVKAKFDNNRYQRPKKQPKTSTKYVDWFRDLDGSICMLLQTHLQHADLIGENGS